MTLPNVAKLEYSVQDINDKIDKRADVTPLWDFEEGEFALKDGKFITVEGIEFLKVWIKKALLTVKRTLIYQDTNYGSEHYSLIGSNFNPFYVEEELRRMIREALLVNAAITDVTNFQFEQTGSVLMIEFDVNSIYGNISGEVEING